VTLGVGDATVDLSGERTRDLAAAIETGVGAVRLVLPDGLPPDGIPHLGVGAFVLLLQLSVVFVFYTLQREQSLRSELAEAYVGLQSAEAIVSETARSAERLHIARELHDLLGHQLTLLNLKLEAAKHHSKDSSAEHIEHAQSVAHALLDDVRTAVADLRTSRISSLPDALNSIGHNLSNLDVNIEVAGDVEVDEEQQIVLLRALQEIVTNSVRHANAKELSVVIEGDTDRIILAAGDDGQGAIPLVPGNGLQGLRERFARVGGGIEFAADTGFQVRAWMPTR
jgi:signal transduction histidine kinase